MLHVDANVHATNSPHSRPFEPVLAKGRIPLQVRPSPCPSSCNQHGPQDCKQSDTVFSGSLSGRDRSLVDTFQSCLAEKHPLATCSSSFAIILLMFLIVSIVTVQCNIVTPSFEACLCSSAPHLQLGLGCIKSATPGWPLRRLRGSAQQTCRCAALAG